MDRYQARKQGKDWQIVDSSTGECVDTCRSRKGLSAVLLETRALNRARSMSESHAAGMILINGYFHKT